MDDSEYLAWAAVTLAGILNLLRGLSAERFAGVPVVAFGLEDALEPSVLFLFTLIVLYVVRWHILWRAERLECRRREAFEPSQAGAGTIGKSED